MKTTTNNAVHPTLYMDNGGRIECNEHAPYRDSDSWILNDWRAMTRRETFVFQREVGRAPACETCAAIARRALEKAST